VLELWVELLLHVTEPEAQNVWMTPLLNSENVVDDVSIWKPHWDEYCQKGHRRLSRMRVNRMRDNISLASATAFCDPSDSIHPNGVSIYSHHQLHSHCSAVESSKHFVLPAL
jgi:hypothetical protein